MKTNRIDAAIQNAQKCGRVAFIGLVPVIAENPEKSVEVADVMIASGVDILMMHIPNWMPWMEGPVLELAARAPRNAGITREKVFDVMRQIRAKNPDVPLIDMTLFDTALTMGQEHFMDLSRDADVDGFDLPDYPLFSSDDKYGLYRECVKENRYLILDISYEMATAQKETPEYDMLCGIAQKAHGFVFVMNAPGGQSGSAKKLTQEQLGDAVKNVKRMLHKYHNDTCTVSVVCGISTPEDIEKVRRAGAESFMIGSAYVKYLQEGKSLDEIASYLRSLSNACHYQPGEGAQ